MWIFNKRKNIDYDNLLVTLEKGEEAEVQKLLWQPKQGQVNYLTISTIMLQKLKKPNSTNKGLSIFKKIEKDNYELIIFNTPWKESDIPFSPLVLDKLTGKVVGVMLPFNELHNYISKKDSSIIGDLGTQWILFTFECRKNKIKP